MNMSFGEALIFLKLGKSLCRESWKGKNLSVYLFMPQSLSITVEEKIA